MNRLLVRFVVLALASLSVCLQSQAQDDQAEAAEKSKERQAERLEAMRQRIEMLTLVARDEEKELAVGKEPLFRYSDPTRGIIDATMWSIGSGGRPNAILVLEFYDKGTISYELTSVTDPPKQVSATRLNWQPRFSPLVFQPLANAGTPSENKVARDRQVKQLARRFDATEEFNGTFPLRLMPKPIHQYTDAERGVVDGAIFAMAHGTNVEVLMILEAQESKESKDKLLWAAGFARLAAAALDVRFGDAKFWAADSNFGGPTSSYGNFEERQTLEELTLFLTVREE